MSEISKIIEACIQLELAAALKADGYKKRSRTFYRAAAGTTRVVNVQSSQSNVGDTGKFTLNLGVYFPEVERVAQNDSTLEYPAESQCSLRERIGMILPARTDRWWEVGAGIDSEQISRELVQAWRTHGKDWMERHATPELALAQPDRGLLGPIRIASIHLLGGRAQDAAEEIEREIRTTRNPSFRKRLFRWAEFSKLSIQPPRET